MTAAQRLGYSRSSELTRAIVRDGSIHSRTDWQTHTDTHTHTHTHTHTIHTHVNVRLGNRSSRKFNRKNSEMLPKSVRRNLRNKFFKVLLFVPFLLFSSFKHRFLISCGVFVRKPDHFCSCVCQFAKVQVYCVSVPPPPSRCRPTVCEADSVSFTKTLTTF